MTVGGASAPIRQRSSSSDRCSPIWAGGGGGSTQPSTSRQGVTDVRKVATVPPPGADRKVKDQLSDLARSLAGPRSSRLERAAALLQIADAADRLARAEVATAREQDGASWADVGKALG